MTIQISRLSVPPYRVGNVGTDGTGLDAPVPGSRFRAFRSVPGTDGNQREQADVIVPTTAAPCWPRRRHGDQPP